jgi:predicted SnoaL-like aldol condensation-catalyzing enzyme
MSTEENKALARRLIEEAFNAGNLDVADELLAPDHVRHDPLSGDQDGPESFKSHVASLRGIFPDLHIQIENQIAEGDLVATRWTRTGTHIGGSLSAHPISPGTRVTLPGMEFVRISNGKLVETLVEYNVVAYLAHWGFELV